MHMFNNKTLFIDLDGTMYHGDQVIEGALAFVAYLQKEHIPFCFLTNNAMRTHAQNRIKMEEMGFEHIRDDQFFTSAMASARYMRHHSHAQNVYYIGQEGLREALVEAGFIICDQDVELVFVGLDQQANYQTYSEAYAHLQKGAILVGTNPDRRLPAGNTFKVGNGAIVHMLEYCSGQQSIMIGKPCAPMMEEALRYVGVRKEDCIIIGDNLETDIAFGLQHGVETIFVSGGVHELKDCDDLQIYPHHCIRDLRELIHK